MASLADGRKLKGMWVGAQNQPQTAHAGKCCFEVANKLHVNEVYGILSNFSLRREGAAIR